MNKVLSLIAVVGLFSFAGCKKCAECDCTVTMSDTQTLSGVTTTTSATRNETFTACDHDITYWEENPTMTESGNITWSGNAGDTFSTSTSYSCTCEKK